MAITITTTLESDLPAFAPCVVSGTCSRAPITSSGELVTYSITAYSNQSGSLAILVPIGPINASTVIKEGDTIVISGATGNAEVFNGRHKIYTITTDTVVTETVYPSLLNTPITSSGILTRTNDSMKVRADVFKGSTFIDSIYAQPIKNTWELDISGSLRPHFESIFTLEQGNRPVDGSVFPYTVKFYEQWHNPDYSIESEESEGTVLTGLAHRSVDLTNCISGNLLLSSDYQSKYKILHHFTTDKTTNVWVRFTPYETDVMKTPELFEVDIRYKHSFIVYNIANNPEITKVLVETLWFNGEDYESIKDILTVNVPQQDFGQRLYFLNSKGGFQTIECISWEDTAKVKRVDR